MCRCTVYWLKSLISGERLFIRCDQVKVCFAPQYESLSLGAILDQAFTHGHARRYFPEDRDLHRLPRAWCLNVAYSVIGGAWKSFIDGQIEQRNVELKQDRGLTIDMEPSIAEIFSQSTAVSSK